MAYPRKYSFRIVNYDVMSNFPLSVTLGSIVIYDQRAFIRMATGLG